MKFFTTSNSKIVIATLRIVTIEILSWHSFLCYISMVSETSENVYYFMIGFPWGFVFTCNISLMRWEKNSKHEISTRVN